MLILLAFIFLAIIIVGIVLSCSRNYYENESSHSAKYKKWFKLGRNVYINDINLYPLIGGSICLVVVLCALLLVGVSVSKAMVIDDKIAMYEEENAAINHAINMIVENYQKYELDVFDGVTEDISPTVVLSLYPELKSNTLVAKQIDTYVENQKAIKKLKSDKLDYEVYKWWLCF